MQNNEVLKRLRYALNLPEVQVAAILAAAGREVSPQELEGIFLSEGEPGFVVCDDELMVAFLDALVVELRGKREGPPEAAARRDAGAARRGRLTNNDILKRLRVALALKDEDLAAIMGLAGIEVSRSELSALFRKPGHHNYRPCGDQFLRNFLAGLTAKRRG